MVSQPSHPQIVAAELSRHCLLEPPVPELPPSSLHIWQFPVTPSPLTPDRHTSLLSSDERVRASRFHFEKDARRFTITRAALRSILGGYTRTAASDLRFDYAHHGKPSLAENPANIRFSVSHSGGLAMIAITLAREVGVDIEAFRNNIETDKLAERFFSAPERESLRLLSAPNRVAAFFRCWTCKEAFLKAQGLGLSRSLDSFDVEVNPERPAQLLATRPHAEEAGQWSLHGVETDCGYAAAAAVEGSIETIRVLRCR